MLRVAELTAWLGQAGVARGGQVGLAVAPDGAALTVIAPGGAWTGTDLGELGLVDAELRPRWVVWSGSTAAACARRGVRLATCWDIAAVHRLLYGGWRADPGLAWARLHGHAAAVASASASGEPDLFDLTEDSDEPLGPDGLLRSSWVNGAWASSRDRMAGWAALAVEVASLQRAALAKLTDRPMAMAVALSESAAELLSVELSTDGLPMDRALAERLLGEIIGPRPRTDGEALAQRAARDELVLRHAPPGCSADLRSPVQVRDLLRRMGIDVPDTRAPRLRELRDKHPLVAALLEWRKAERIATTYGYGWLDAQLGADGRLRGEWTGSDGAAGRMTASAGLHNMPSVLRAAVVAEPGQVFVRADLGQVEPRVLAAISGDPALAAATLADDLYAPVADALKVDRPTAKVAVLGAMYGQTTGHGAAALRRLTSAYPVAMAYLDAGDRAGQAGRDLRTYGGRLVSMARGAGASEQSSARAARGRYGRNALVQGAAAEFFKMWAVTVRARAATVGGHIVLCLHDELLLQMPAGQAEAAARLVADCLAETASRWAPGSAVRFRADIRVVSAWSDAKG